MQAELDVEAARVAAVRSDISGCERQLQELRVTYAAKQEMIGAAQDGWSAEAASCKTRVVPLDAAAPPESSTANLADAFKSKLQAGRLSLRRAVSEVRHDSASVL